MSAKCPLCHAPVKDDFGLQECSSCNAQLIVHMDGRVEFKGNDSVPAEDAAPVEDEIYREVGEFDTPEGPPDLVPPSAGGSFMLPEDHIVPEPEPQFISNDREETLSRSDQANPSEELPPLDQEPYPAANEETILQVKDNGATTFDFDTPPDGVEEEAAPPAAVYTSAVSPSSPDLSDIAAFGNSEMSGGRDGSLRYNITIEGIDTADVREAFREAITDRKFVWDIDQILRSVRNGKVQIHNVAPTKGYILVTRLRGLPLKIRWEQYAIQQT